MRACVWVQFLGHKRQPVVLNFRRDLHIHVFNLGQKTEVEHVETHGNLEEMLSNCSPIVECIGSQLSQKLSVNHIVR